MTTSPRPVPTQVKSPWRATARSIFQAIVALCVVLPFVVDASGVDAETVPFVGAVLGVAAAITRIMALPQVEGFLQRFVPFLAATSRRG